MPRQSRRARAALATEPFCFQFVGAARRRLKVAWQVEDGPTPRARGYNADVIEALLRQSGDLETALPGWLREGFHLGIETVIGNCGIFLATAADMATVQVSRIFDIGGFSSSRHKNYLSSYESVDHAQADLGGHWKKSRRSSAKTRGSRAVRAW